MCFMMEESEWFAYEATAEGQETGLGCLKFPFLIADGPESSGRSQKRSRLILVPVNVMSERM